MRRAYCICCDGFESFGFCPLCENERVFDYEEYCGEDPVLLDFYDEAAFEPHWLEKDDEEKLRFLNLQIENYFSAG